MLASGSTTRKNLLLSAGIEPEVLVSGVDEDTQDETRSGPLAVLLATQKAEAVVHKVAGRAVVLGCDSVLDLDGVAFGKPQDEAQAIGRWHGMRGRIAQLLTGHCVLVVDDCHVTARAEAVGTTTVRFGYPSDDEIRAYVASGEPLSCAGGFTIDGRGGFFVDGVNGCPSNVLGLSLPLFRKLLGEVGVALPELW